MNTRSSIRALTFLLAALLVAGGVCYTRYASAETETDSGYAAIYSENNPVPAIAKRVGPAVVQVISMQETWDPATRLASTVETGYGSGVYIDERGYVVTNYHVVADAEQVELELLDGRRIPVDEVFFDDSTDLAVLKFSGDIGAQPVPIGDSDALVIGELAIAIGNPGTSSRVYFGTVTVGVISALDRAGVNANNFSRAVNMIQTDAAINSGNSGGALLNRKGELIGIPTIKIMSNYDTVFEGLGFAIPANTVKTITSALIEHGKVVRPRMGVMVKNIEGPEEPLRNYPPAGVIVDSVEAGSPAEKAGLKRYDIIAAVDGTRVHDYVAMTTELDKHQAGDTVSLTVYRYYDALTGTALTRYEALTLEIELQILD